MLVASTTHYGSVTLTKKLVILGPGYFLRQNYPDYPVTNIATTQSIQFNNGSQGTVISGLSGGGNYMYVTVSDISVTRNNGYSVILYSNVSNILIGENYNISVGSSGSCSNVLIRNNYLLTSSNFGNFGTTCPSLFLNNLIGNISSQSFTNQSFINNIAVNSTGLNLIDCNINNNIDAAGASSFKFGTENGNQGGFTSAQVFVGPSGTSTDGQWKLRDGSPATGAGSNGEDCGIFGGFTPYMLSGLPAVPIIKKFLTTGVGTDTSPVNVVVSLESKN